MAGATTNDSDEEADTVTILRATIGGRLAGAQRWSVGFTFGLTSVFPTPDQASALATQLFTDFDTSVWSNVSGGASPYKGYVGTPSTLDQCRVYVKESSSAPAAIVGSSSNAAVAGTLTPAQAPQISLVVTLEDGLAGRSHKGRIYLPFRASVDDPVAGINVGRAQTLATQVANFLSLARTRGTGGVTLTPIVSSLTSTNPITRCSVDTILDTQRRRRDKIVGTRVGTNLIVG
uniref:Uncharacterized protein n=1 Tax=uncultured prokaryote TaxID=198431 RepID=A0A0H5Q282_9ZZZZ|nr:hypothetical protein [uncultured prokaryote]